MKLVTFKDNGMEDSLLRRVQRDNIDEDQCSTLEIFCFFGTFIIVGVVIVLIIVLI